MVGGVLVPLLVQGVLNVKREKGYLQGMLFRVAGIISTP